MHVAGQIISENGFNHISHRKMRTNIWTIRDALDQLPGVHVSAFAYLIDQMTRIIFFVQGLTDVLPDTVICRSHPRPFQIIHCVFIG